MISTTADLTTADELLLLAIEPDSGRISARPPFTLPYALAGAMLMDVMRDQRVTLTDAKLAAGPDTGEPWCDAILARIRRMPLPQGIGYWVNAFAYQHFRAQDRTTWRLIERGLVTIDVRLTLGLVPSTRYYLAQPAVRDAIAARIASALTTEDAPGPQIVSLIAMAAACRILEHLVDRPHRRAAMRRARTMLQGDASATDTALAAAQYTYAASMEVYASVCAGGHGAGGGHGGGGHGGH